MGRSNYADIKEIVEYILDNYENEITRCEVEELIRQKIGGSPPTVSGYLKLLDSHYGLVSFRGSSIVMKILPNGITKPLYLMLGRERALRVQSLRNMTRPASAATLSNVAAAEYCKNPGVDDKPVVGLYDENGIVRPEFEK